MIMSLAKFSISLCRKEYHGLVGFLEKKLKMYVLMSTCVMNVVNMATKNVVADLTKGEKLDGTNYDMWHRKIQILLNEQEVLETINNVMMRLENGNTAQRSFLTQDS